jgi:type II secretory pathway pseudopilin PulG
MRPRRGHTLIETLVVVGLVGAALTTVTLTLHTLYRSERRLRDGQTLGRAWDRLACQLRQDAHQALSATLAGDAADAATTELSLALPSAETIRYTLRPDHIERLVRRDDTVRHRELYPLPAFSLARWQIQTERALPLVTLTVSGPPAGGQVPGDAELCRAAAVVKLLRPQHAEPKP